MPFYTKNAIVAEFEKKNMYKDPKTMIMYWHRQDGMVDYLLNEDKPIWKQQLHTWRRQAKKGELYIRKCNSIQREYKGRNWYCFALQYKETEDDKTFVGSPMDMMVFGRVVSGISYWFSNKSNRDKSQQYIMRGLLAPPL